MVGDIKVKMERYIDVNIITQGKNGLENGNYAKIILLDMSFLQKWKSRNTLAEKRLYILFYNMDKRHLYLSWFQPWYFPKQQVRLIFSNVKSPYSLYFQCIIFDLCRLFQGGFWGFPCPLFAGYSCIEDFSPWWIAFRYAFLYSQYQSALFYIVHPKVSLVFGNKQYLGGISVTIFIPYSLYNFNPQKINYFTSRYS